MITFSSVKFDVSSVNPLPWQVFFCCSESNAQNASSSHYSTIYATIIAVFDLDFFTRTEPRNYLIAKYDLQGYFHDLVNFD